MNMSLSRKFFSNVLPSVRSYYSIKVRHSNLTSSYQCLNSLILKAKCQTVFPHKKNTRDFCLRDKIEEVKDAEERIAKEIFTKVNTQLHSEEYGRLFAVIHLCGKQFKVTAEDVIVVQNDLSLETGERIRLEKVLLVGGKDFTLVGRPLLKSDMVRVEATVIEKTLSHVVTHFKLIPRKNSRRMNFYRFPLTMLRINSIEIMTCDINSMSSIEGIQDRIF